MRQTTVTSSPRISRTTQDNIIKYNFILTIQLYSLTKILPFHFYLNEATSGI